VVTVGDGRHASIPAGSTIPAGIPLIRGRADTSGFVGRFALRQYHRRMTETTGRLLPDHMSRGTKNEVGREPTVLGTVCFNDTVLAGRDPVKRTGRVLCYLADIPEMGHRLEVARVVPSKEFDFLPIEQGDERSGPARILEALESVLQCFLHDREDIAAFEGIAARAYATLDGTQFGTDTAPLGWDAGRVPGHLRWLRQSSDDGVEILYLTGDLDGGILHGDGVRCSDSEVH